MVHPCEVHGEIQKLSPPSVSPDNKLFYYMKTPFLELYLNQLPCPHGVYDKGCIHNACFFLNSPPTVCGYKKTFPTFTEQDSALCYLLSVQNKATRKPTTYNTDDSTAIVSSENEMTSAPGIPRIPKEFSLEVS